ncbi:MAG: hypothetical protein AAF417_22930 [Pseudomonadota bacterium]
MATWEICYEADGVRYNELVEDPGYGDRLSQGQIEDLADGLRGESDDAIDIVWVRPHTDTQDRVTAAEQLWPLRTCHG